MNLFANQYVRALIRLVVMSLLYMGFGPDALAPVAASFLIAWFIGYVEGLLDGDKE